jgi:hypothetical protein
VTVYRNTIAKALREELGTVKLTALTAGTAQKALAAIASWRSTRTVQITHNVLALAIRYAVRDDLVGRNVAALVKPPKGQLGGRPSKSLTLEQAVASMAAAPGSATGGVHRVVAAVRAADGGGAGAAVGSRGGLGFRAVGARR